MKRLFILLSLIIISCMDTNDKSFSHRVTFNNKTLESITISDDSKSDEPLFPTYTIPPNQIVTLEYTCEDCPVFSFQYNLEDKKYTICLCNDGTDFLPSGVVADFSFGYCPSFNFSNDQDRAEGKCSRCKTPDPCQSFGI